MTLPLVLWQPDSFFHDLAFELLGLGLFYSALLLMLAYHLFVLYWLKEASYVYFICFLGSIILWLFVPVLSHVHFRTSMPAFTCFMP